MTTTTTFADLGLNESIVQAIEELGYETPTPIQERVIPIFLQQQNDLIALAQTGTGKTAAFGLPLLQNIDPKARHTQALVLSPTRELCVQIANDLKNYSKHLPNVQIVAVYGGANIMQQIRDLQRGAHIIVATPGRLMDLMERESVRLQQLRFMILDEADEMLNMGFEEDVRKILAETPEDKKVGLFSATMPHAIRSIAEQYLTDPVEVAVSRKNSMQENIEHQYTVVDGHNKYEALKRMLDYHSDFYGIIFCATKVQTQDISDALVRDGYPADCLHGDLSQPQRDKVMNHFRHKAIKILLATDVAARGIDVNDLTHVVHYQLPHDDESYTHRSGRTARAGKTGVSISILTPKETFLIPRMEKYLRIQFTHVLVPKAEEVRDKKLTHFMNTIALSEIDEHLQETLADKIGDLEALEKKDLIFKILSLELRRYSADYLNKPDLNAYPRDKRKREEGGERSFERSGERSSERTGGKRFEQGEMVRFFINIGSKDRMRYDEMRDFIFDKTGVKGKHIRDIDLKDSFAFFNADSHIAAELHQAFIKNTIEMRGRQIRVEYADGEAKGGGTSGGGDKFKKFGGKYSDSDRSGKFDKFGKSEKSKFFDKSDTKFRKKKVY